MNKKYRLCFFIGRFQHIHMGHEKVIDIALENAEKVIILVGSSQEKGTLRNPFSVETRMKLIKAIYGDRVIVVPLPDLTDEGDITFDWGNYLIDNIVKFTGEMPDLMVYGQEESRNGWFSPEIEKSINAITIEKKDADINATKLRKMIADDNIEEWKKFTNYRIHKYFETIREELLNCVNYK